MTTWESNYLEVLDRVMKHGEDVPNDRTGVGTRMRTNQAFEVEDVNKTFPVPFTKKLAWKSVIGELLWFLSGSTNETELARITHGDSTKSTIWRANYEDFVVKRGKPQDVIADCRFLGPIYGKQWRDFGGVDQITELVEGMKKDPFSRRHVVSAWNPPAIPKMALPPCHMLFQVNVLPSGVFDMAVMQRSGDAFLGIPFNLASYAALMKILEHETGIIARKLTLVCGNLHIYSNHFDAVQQQINNAWDMKLNPEISPTLTISKDYRLFDTDISKFTLNNYVSKGTISAPMAV